MRIMKVVIISLFSILIFVIVLSALMHRAENPESYFDDYEEAKASGIMDKGWIPTFIPKSSTEIYEQHNIDINWVRMRFKYRIGDMSATRNACSNEVAIKNGVQFICEYFNNKVTLKLYNDGTAELRSTPK